MSLLSLFLDIGLVILSLVTALWLLSLLIKDSSIVDIFWGTGFVIAYWVATTLVPGGLTPRLVLLGALVTVWGLVDGFQPGGDDLPATQRLWRSHAGEDTEDSQAGVR